MSEVSEKFVIFGWCPTIWLRNPDRQTFLLCLIDEVVPVLAILYYKLVNSTADDSSLDVLSKHLQL